MSLIFKQLPKVAAAVGVVGKGKKNTQQNYQFRGVDDVVAAVQGAMTEMGVTCVPRVVSSERETLATKSGGTMASVRLTVDHHFFAEDGSSVVCTTVGEAMDSGDKASNKAMSAALKYALTQTLLIPTYEADRDTEDDSPEMAPKPKAADELETAIASVVAAFRSATTVDELGDVWRKRVTPVKYPTDALARLTSEFKTCRNKLAPAPAVPA